MLKKLAKYGNSTTLVIDKAILEILNMDESSIVKLQTDGRSLIITPIPADHKDKVSYGPEEAMMLAMKTNHTKQLEKSPPISQELIAAMQQDFMLVFRNHRQAMMKFSQDMVSNQEFQEALTTLAQKYDPITQSEDYLKEFLIVRNQFIPELAELDKEIAVINQKYNNI